MKLITATLLSALSCYTELAAAATGRVITLDPSLSSHEHLSNQHDTLSPETARLVIAQRAGLEDYHVEKALDKEEINAINAHGLQTSSLSKDNTDRVFILAFVDDEESEGMLGYAPCCEMWIAYLLANTVLAQKAHSFAVSPAPSASETKAFFEDLSAQDNDRVYNWGEIEQQFATGEPMNWIHGDNSFILGLPLERVEMLLEMGVKVPTTIMLMPATGSDASTWGTYSMPNTEAPLQKRRQIEVPLSESFESASASSAVEPAPMSTPLTTFAKSNQSSPLRGILPACFGSQDECEKTTRNCTGHGKCRKQFHNRDAAKGDNGDCYSCQCSATKEDRGDGKVKTTVWGGPACQKQDVSMAFWLIALFTVGMIFLVSFAVGSVMSMGSEELPSVIGAGVSGPVKR